MKTSKLNTTRVELPDGRLLTIEGGNSHETANLILHHYLAAPPVAGQAEEEALEMPSMSFNKPSTITAPQSAPSSFVVGNQEEEPLTMPTMDFSHRLKNR